MADAIKLKNTLTLVAEFADGDDRTINLDDPSTDISASKIQAVSDFIKENQLIIGDKEGASFTRIKSAKVVRGTSKILDLA